MSDSVFALVSFPGCIEFCRFSGLLVVVGTVRSGVHADLDCFWECATRFCSLLLFQQRSAVQAETKVFFQGYAFA